MMPLHVNVIAGEKLLERWHISEAELLMMQWNHELKTVHREWHTSGWVEDFEDDLTRMLIEENQGISNFIFRMLDVLALEKKPPEPASKSRKVMRGKDLVKRWNIAGVELLDVVEE